MRSNEGFSMGGCAVFTCVLMKLKVSTGSERCLGLDLNSFSFRAGFCKPFLELQGSRVRPIWSHVHPNFSRVRLTKIPGRTGASSHSRKEKKVSPVLWFKKRPPLGLYRGLNQSEIVKGGPPPLIGRGPDIPVCVCARWQMRHVCCRSQTERKRLVEMRAVLPT